MIATPINYPSNPVIKRYSPIKIDNTPEKYITTTIPLINKNKINKKSPSHALRRNEIERHPERL
jgi:hypothetical protein